MRPIASQGRGGPARPWSSRPSWGVPGVRGAGTSTEVDSLSADTMVIEPDGTFEIYVAPTNDVGAPNFLMSGSIVDPSTGETLATETILVRYSHMDWDNEQPGQVNISRIENEGLQTPNLDSQTMVERTERSDRAPARQHGVLGRLPPGCRGQIRCVPQRLPAPATDARRPGGAVFIVLLLRHPRGPCS